MIPQEIEKMKGKRLRLAFVMSAIMLMASGCMISTQDYEEELLYGTWNCNQLGLSYVFNADHTGCYYDKNNDGLSYTWSLYSDVLEIKVSGSGVGVAAYETYILTSQSETRFECYDELEPSKSLTFIKK